MFIQEAVAELIASHPAATLFGIGALGIFAVVVIVRALLHLFVDWADVDPDSIEPHAFSPLNPGHCDRCWKEASQRHALRELAAAHRRRSPDAPRVSSFVSPEYRAGRWPRI